jgi:hypothetical protein
MLKAYRKTVKKNRVNGMKGGRPRKDAASSDTQEKPSGLPLGTQSEPTGNPNQELLTNNHKPLTTNQVIDKPKAKRFTPPTYEEAGSYFESKGSVKQEANRFVDYHTSKGWIVGRVKMKDWKASARTWLSNSYGKASTQLPPAQNFESGSF